MELDRRAAWTACGGCRPPAASPRTLYARTGSGGWHLLYAHPGTPVANSVGRLGPGLDIRGDSGQIVAAPWRRGQRAAGVSMTG